MGIFLMGCSSKSTIVLADNNQTHNAIVISTKKGSTLLDKTGSYIDLKSENQLPNEIKLMSKEEISNRFKEALEAQPSKGETFILYFEIGGTTLTEESQNILTKALQSIHTRYPCMVDVIGHTDTVGTEEHNQEVSLQRANFIKGFLISKNIDTNILTTKGYGENDLLVPTKDEVDEAKNRNVEIFVK